MANEVCEVCEIGEPVRTCGECLTVLCAVCSCECVGGDDRGGRIEPADVENAACVKCGGLAIQNCKTCGVNLCGNAGTLDFAHGSMSAARLQCPVCHGRMV